MLLVGDIADEVVVVGMGDPFAFGRERRTSSCSSWAGIPATMASVSTVIVLLRVVGQRGRRFGLVVARRPSEPSALRVGVFRPERWVVLPHGTQPRVGTLPGSGRGRTRRSGGYC